MGDPRWDNPNHEPMSNGPIRTVTGPKQPKYLLDSDRREMEYLLAFPFHIVDPEPWPALNFLHNDVPVTIYKPLCQVATHATSVQMGNEEADAYCTVVRLSTPLSTPLGEDEGWKIVRRLLEWIRVKCRHYWLLHGIAGFGATYRGTMFVQEGTQFSQQNIALYGPNVIVNPITRDTWSTIADDLNGSMKPPLEDSLYCDSLLSIVAGDSIKAFLEAGVAIEVALTKLLVDVSTSGTPSPAKAKFIKVEGDRQPFGKKLCEWTRDLGLEPIESFTFPGIPPMWHETVRNLYKLRNGVAHAGKSPVKNGFHDVVTNMFAAGALLEYCREQRLRLRLETFLMPPSSTPWKHIRFCHDGNLKTTSSPSSAVITWGSTSPNV